jgi:hypothetical protein
MTRCIVEHVGDVGGDVFLNTTLEGFGGCITLVQTGSHQLSQRTNPFPLDRTLHRALPL